MEERFLRVRRLPWQETAPSIYRVLPMVGFIFLLLLPFRISEFQIVQVTLWLISGLLALSLDLVWGVGGIFSFGQAAFFGVGGYAYGVFAINLLGRTHETLSAVVAGVCMAAALAAVIGYFMFYGRLGDVYVAVITLAVTLILLSIMNSTAGTQYAIGKALLGGNNGMTNIPSLTLPIPGGKADPLGIIGTYMVIVVITGILYALVAGLLRRPFGHIVTALRENEVRTELLGYDTRLLKLWTFVLGGGIAGLAGTFYAAWGNYINPAVFSLQQSALIVIWVLVGGRGTLLGAFIGATFVQYLAGILGTFSQTRPPLVLGLILIAIVLVFPGGLMALFTDVARFLHPGRLPSPLSHRLPAPSPPSDNGGVEIASRDGEVIFKAEDLVKSFGGLRALDGVNMTLRRGDLRCLIGPNGAGKSTFFNLLIGRYRVSSGRIIYRGEDITYLEPHDRVRRGLSIKLQIPSIYDRLSVRQNLWVAAYGKDRRWLQVDRRVGQVLTETNLQARSETVAGDLSHGEKQWLEIGMVLVSRPAMILLDEPTAGMTKEEVAATVNLVRRLSLEATVVVVEHDMSFVRQLNAWVTVLHQGRTFAEGYIEDLRGNESVMDIYLGRETSAGA